jgi:hypothetical protein
MRRFREGRKDLGHEKLVADFFRMDAHEEQEVIADIADHMITLHRKLKRSPEFLARLARQQAQESLRSASRRIRKIQTGKIRLRKAACLRATIECMRQAKKNVFAISFPDLDFWNNDGHVYLKANHETAKNVKITRYFVIRNHSEDVEIVRNEPSRSQFAEVIRSHVVPNLDVFLIDGKGIKLHQVDLRSFPDISIYDDAIVSEWLRRADSSEGRIDVSQILYEGKRISVMRDLAHLLRINAGAIPINSDNIDKSLKELAEKMSSNRSA